MQMLSDMVSRHRELCMKQVRDFIKSFFTLTPFASLNYTQFIGAMNDNIFKLLIVYCFIKVEGHRSASDILARVGATYVIPFLLFSSAGGTLADKYSKKKIIVITRIAEICVMVLGIVAFWFENKFLAFSALFLLASHSAIFGPCKYGIVPEIVPKEDISKANGILSSFTYTAIIVGTFLASFLTDITNRHFVIACTITLCFSIFSLYTSSKIPYTPPAGSKKVVTAFFLSEIWRNFRLIRQEPSLLTAVFGSSFFLFVGSFAQLNMIPYAMNLLDLSDIQGGYMFLLTALGIGGGSILAGKCSGKAVELGLVPIGGLGMAISCFLLDYYSHDLYIVMPLVALLGLFGGLYLVPLDSYIQVTSPKTRRGQVVATTNFLGFIGVLCSSALLYILSEVLHVAPDKGFVIIGSLTLVMVLIISISISGYVIRFSSLILSRVFFPNSIEGKQNIPLDVPSFFLVCQPFWPWSTILLASQRRRMRLFYVNGNTQTTHSFWGNLARYYFPIIEISSLDEIAPHGSHGEIITHAISRDNSIGVFFAQNELGPKEKEWFLAWKQALKYKKPSFFLVQHELPSEQHESLSGKIIPFAG